MALSTAGLRGQTRTLYQKMRTEYWGDIRSAQVLSVWVLVDGVPVPWDLNSFSLSVILAKLLPWRNHCPLCSWAVKAAEEHRRAGLKFITAHWSWLLPGPLPPFFWYFCLSILLSGHCMGLNNEMIYLFI